MLGGSIEIQSRGANQGSEFRVRLPLLAEAAVEERQQVEADQARKHGVLVVDDNKAATEMLSMIVAMLDNGLRTSTTSATFVKRTTRSAYHRPLVCRVTGAVDVDREIGHPPEDLPGDE